MINRITLNLKEASRDRNRKLNDWSVETFEIDPSILPTNYDHIVSGSSGTARGSTEVVGRSSAPGSRGGDVELRLFSK